MIIHRITLFSYDRDEVVGKIVCRGVAAIKPDCYKTHKIDIGKMERLLNGRWINTRLYVHPKC